MARGANKTTKEVTEEINEEVKTDSTKKTTAKKTQPTRKSSRTTFKPNDLILCKSLFAGTLLFDGIKSKVIYRFANMGDTQYIEYQDLLASMLSESDIIYKPYIIVQDEEVLKETHWNKVNDLYSKLYDEEDIEILLNMPYDRFSKEVKLLPVGVLDTVKTVISTRIQNGTFDSANKVKLIDELCGTDMMLLLQ